MLKIFCIKHNYVKHYNKETKKYIARCSKCGKETIWPVVEYKIPVICRLRKNFSLSHSPSGFLYYGCPYALKPIKKCEQCLIDNKKIKPADNILRGIKTSMNSVYGLTAAKFSDISIDLRDRSSMHPDIMPEQYIESSVSRPTDFDGNAFAIVPVVKYEIKED